MKFLVDMNFVAKMGRLPHCCRSRSHSLLERRLGRGSDAAVMHWAAERGCVVLTNDLGFGAILAATQGRRPSVVQIRSGILTPQVIGPTVLAAIGRSAQELTTGALVSIDVGRARLRVLPLSN